MVGLPIRCGEVADHRGWFDEIISANDGAAKAGATAYEAVVHDDDDDDDAIFNIDVGLDHYLVPDHRISNIAAFDHGSSSNNAVSVKQRG